MTYLFVYILCRYKYLKLKEKLPSYTTTVSETEVRGSRKQPLKDAKVTYLQSNCANC